LRGPSFKTALDNMQCDRRIHQAIGSCSNWFSLAEPFAVIDLHARLLMAQIQMPLFIQRHCLQIEFCASSEKLSILSHLDSQRRENGANT
jgi:hypothetical protein